MQVPVKIERIEGRGYRAIAPEPFDVCAEAVTRAEAISKITEALQTRTSKDPEIVSVEVPLIDNPWRRVSGMYKDDPLFDEWKGLMAEYRDQIDREEGIV